MKEAGLDHWNAPNTGATNESGFNARGSGEREITHFQFLGTASVMWASDYVSGVAARYVYLSHDDAETHKLTWDKNLAYSVRCVRD